MAVTATTTDRTDAQVLRAQAKALQRAADKLADERMEILRESWAMEAEADRLEAEAPAPVTILPRPVPEAEHDAALMTRVAELMALVNNDVTTAQVAEEMAISPTRARAVLARLERIGMVTRVGIKSATRYRLTAEAEAPTPEASTHAKVHEFGNYRVAVRDAAIRLGTFEIASIIEALPDLSEGTVRRYVKAMADDGLFEVERIDGRNVYTYSKPEGPTKARPKRATPEAEAVRDAPSRGRVVAGAGRAKVGSPVVDALIREVAPYGVTVTFSKHRVEYRLDGRVVATSSKTPGASHLDGTRKELRKAGVPV